MPDETLAITLAHCCDVTGVILIVAPALEGQMTCVCRVARAGSYRGQRVCVPAMKVNYGC